MIVILKLYLNQLIFSFDLLYCHEKVHDKKVFSCGNSNPCHKSLIITLIVILDRMALFMWAKILIKINYTNNKYLLLQTLKEIVGKNNAEFPAKDNILSCCTEYL